MFFLVLALAASPALRAASWWNSEWTLRRKITVDTSATGFPIGDTIGSVPVLVRLTDGNLRFSSAQADGSDLRFVAEDDKTLLPFHIEKFDGLLNEALVWVRVPEVKPSARTSFWLYYGNSGGKFQKAEDAKATYDEGAVLVYHFNEHGQPANDFTMGGSNATAAGLPSDGAQIGPGLRLDGKTVVTIPDTAALGWTDGAPFTWSAWIKPAAAQPGALIYSRRANGRGLAIGIDNGVPFVEVSGAGGARRSAAGATLGAGGWHHLVVASSGAQLTLYVDGEAYSTLRASTPALSGPAVLGGDPAAGTALVGELDELEIAKVERPAGYVKFTAVSQGGDNAGKLVSYGDDEQHTSWLSAFKTGYVGVIIGSLSLDGWVVIGILAVMSLISWIVMVRKAAYVNRVGKANAQFLEDWSHVANDLSVLDSGGADHAKSLGGRSNGANRNALLSAPLYRIYHIGVEEIHHRLGSGGQPDGIKVLSVRSIQAIRAALDGGLIRENQKLNNQMVLLTIAISGGPFLGLLGTVVGVMITFAAVAQAGDVNVNAIAPGIAAALAATVAGLAVAIPALFGYNYLLTRIKSASNDMHVFIDEFVTKLAEFYSDELVVMPAETGGHSSGNS
jgi:biopolymer transport protein ExbB